MPKENPYLSLNKAKIRLLGFTLAPLEQSSRGRLVAVAYRDPDKPLKAEGLDEVAATVHLLKVITRP